MGIYILLESSGSIIIQMRDKELQIQPKRKYAQISINKREIFVRGVLSEGLSISQASKKDNIKLSTAKLIFKKYRETGMFFPKKIACSRINVEITASNLVGPKQVLEGFVGGEAMQSSQKNDDILENMNQVSQDGLFMGVTPLYQMFYYASVWVQSFDFYQINC